MPSGWVGHHILRLEWRVPCNYTLLLLLKYVCFFLLLAKKKIVSIFVTILLFIVLGVRRAFQIYKWKALKLYPATDIHTYVYVHNIYVYILKCPFKYLYVCMQVVIANNHLPACLFPFPLHSIFVRLLNQPQRKFVFASFSFQLRTAAFSTSELSKYGYKLIIAESLRFARSTNCTFRTH